MLRLRLRRLRGLRCCGGSQREQHEPSLEDPLHAIAAIVLLAHGSHVPGIRQIAVTLIVTGAAELFLNQQPQP